MRLPEELRLLTDPTNRPAKAVEAAVMVERRRIVDYLRTESCSRYCEDGALINEAADDIEKGRHWR